MFLSFWLNINLFTFEFNILAVFQFYSFWSDIYLFTIEFNLLFPSTWSLKLSRGM